MEQTSGGRGQGSGSSDAGDGNAALVIPLWQQEAMQWMRVDCLVGAVETALKAGDQATALRLAVELKEAVSTARKLREKAQNL